MPLSTGEMSPESPPGPSPIAPSPKLPGINDHKSPKGKTRKKKQKGAWVDLHSGDDGDTVCGKK